MNRGHPDRDFRITGRPLLRKGGMTLNVQIAAAVVALFALAIANIAGVIAMNAHDQRRLDDEAIGKAIACVMAKIEARSAVPDENYIRPLGYGEQIAARNYGERIDRQQLADLQAKGVSAAAARTALVLGACANAPDPNPAPLPLVTK